MTQSRPPLRRMGRPPRSRSRGQVTHRDQVLARRRAALISLILLVPVTLGAALLTGSRVILIASLVVDIAVGGYIALLLQIKQGQQTGPRWRSPEDEEDISVVTR